MNSRSFVIGLASAALLLGLALTISGCGNDPRDNIPGGHAQDTTAETVNELDLAVKTLSSMSTSKDGDSPAKALFYLNQWIVQVEAPTEKFAVDPLLARIPRGYDQEDPLTNLDRRHYQPTDLFYIQECLWFRDIARRISPRPAPVDLQPWLKDLEKKIGITSAEQIRSAERLFDWTICNIQLDPFPPPPKAAAAGVGAEDRASQPGPIRGEKGPGYWQTPWQALLFGHGDAWQRSRVFLLMCRQAGIPAYMLGVQDASGSGAVRPWLCGVLVKEQFYLFDSELGLPILGPEGRGIATLDQVVADPGLIRAMDTEAPYRVSDAELQGIQVLVDAEPESMSLRMKMLESALIGEKRVVLTCRPSEEEKTIPKLKYISGVTVWRVSLEAEIFQNSVSKVRMQNPQMQAAHLRETFMFFPPNVLAEARHLQFEGQFYSKADEERRGACTIYARLRAPYDAIESLEDSREARQMLGLSDEALQKDAVQRARQIKDLAANAKVNKNHATYFMGLCHFDDGNFKDAEEWFKFRVLKDSQDSPWLAGARYNLARCYEAQGKWSEARELYLADESPQKIGSFLRAQRIEGRK